ncbi:MAG: 16S rRNA (adenine(1518)-N(6)/adenine(1519)-N(6))-dimethyltransferase RsmA [Hahellaceae bacterium]|nr:16S rRNA (adenine(1518)-N(6)/adenine(1519)-N(6))-dimethyltransferase RsmA [Hahellaceae bacterium]MCP5170440.1 16S rRNA (adenine(1518)-N(6)/adenine(1519)-N(6))-dimethyltransferase RsmA [Hahellaceae bacterium]
MAKNSGLQGHQARKRFGQNFLQDHGIIDKIVRGIAPKAGDNLVEIGPGLGALTEVLLEEGDGHLNVVELDRDLIPGLRVKFFNYPGFTIHEADALKFDFNTLATPERPLRLVGNLPYNISTPLIFHLLEHTRNIKDMHFMLQKEVVERLGAHPGDSNYGRLSIMAQYYCRVQPLFIVPPHAFKPQPKVDSAIVRLSPHAQLPWPTKDTYWLERVVKTAFAQRRKTLRNALGTLLDAQSLKQLDVDPVRRPETLSLQEYVRLADWLCDHPPVENTSAEVSE